MRVDVECNHCDKVLYVETEVHKDYQWYIPLCVSCANAKMIMPDTEQEIYFYSNYRVYNTAPRRPKSIE